MTHIHTHTNMHVVPWGGRFVSAQQQTSGGIDEWLWFPNEALHDAVRCYTEPKLGGLFLSGSQQLPSLARKSQHSM